MYLLIFKRTYAIQNCRKIFSSVYIVSQTRDSKRKKKTEKIRFFFFNVKTVNKKPTDIIFLKTFPRNKFFKEK